jgi:hypothetical protein
MVTIFKNIFDKENPNYLTVDQALARIRTGRSKERIDEIRGQLDKERSGKLKGNLPSVCFSGKFSRRADDALTEHSGFMVLDFDEVAEIREKQTDLINHPFVYACWVSPSGNGLKALVRIADGLKHRLHFQALQELFPDVDKSGVNESRVCYESYDPEIYVNPIATTFTKTKEAKREKTTEVIWDKYEIFQKILKWLANRGDAFVTGERNVFIFKLASACCRFGISEDETLRQIETEFLENSTTFSYREAADAVKSAYKRSVSGTARFERDVLIDSVSRKEVQIDPAIFDHAVRPKDVIFGEDVKADALQVYDAGYEDVTGIGVPILDEHFKFKAGEISLLTGIGNYGKTTFWHWLLLMRVVKNGERFAFFSPENFPAHLFYHDFVETLLGADCTPKNLVRPARSVYEAAYDFISKSIFFVYPKDISPTPEYIKERFLELIIKEKVSGVLIDPFNQLTNDYGKVGGRSDKYLETFLSDCTRFAQTNNVFFSLIAHPKMLRKDPDGNYPAPDVFDIADGAMWNNKMDNILVYHRPNHQTDPMSAVCQLFTKKIRRQKSVGKKGTIDFEMARRTRRYFFDGSDPLQKLINERGLDFIPKQAEVNLGWKPMDTEISF